MVVDDHGDDDDDDFCHTAYSPFGCSVNLSSGQISAFGVDYSPSYSLSLSLIAGVISLFGRESKTEIVHAIRELLEREDKATTEASQPHPAEGGWGTGGDCRNIKTLILGPWEVGRPQQVICTQAPKHVNQDRN